MNSRKNTIISAISGIITAFSFICEKAYFLVFISVAPALYMIISDKSGSFRYMFFHMYSFYFFANLWFFSVGTSFLSDKASGYLLSFAITAVISLILSFSASLPFILLKKLKTKNNIIISLIIAFLYIFGEWIHSFPPINFPWNRLCNIVAVNTDLIQSCSLFGGLFVSFVIIIINITAAYFFRYIIQLNFKAIVCMISAVTIFCSNVFIGNTAEKIYTKQKKNPHKVLLIQPDYSIEEKRNLSAERMLKGMLTLAETNITANTKLVIFPETSISERFFNDNFYSKSLYDFSEKYNVSILFGTSHIKDDKRYNACTLIYPDKTVSDIYTKHVLVPFGEYTPPFLPQNMQLLKKPFCKGDKTTLVNSSIGKIGCCICFESIFPKLSRNNSQIGAELFVILTNDSWIGNSVPLYQHHSHSVIRAVENRKYTITCANTGISSVISSDGKVVSYTEKNTAQTLSEKVYTNDILTFYARYGDIIVIPSIAVILYLITINVIYFLKKLAKN